TLSTSGLPVPSCSVAILFSYARGASPAVTPGSLQALAERVDPASRPLGVDRRDTPGDIETARNRAVHDVALAPDPNGQTVHHLPRAPRAELRRIDQIRRDECEGVAMEQEVLSVRDG